MLNDASALIFNMELYTHRADDVILIIQGALSKLLFFIIAYLVAKLRKKREDDRESLTIITSLAVFLLSVVAFLLFIHQLLSNPESHSISIWVTLGVVMLLLANIIVFFIYELSQQTHIKFTQLQLERQRERISAEHYELLFEKQERQKILVHDINKHLQTIQQMETASPEVRKYAASLTGEFGLSDITTYNGNKYVDVIINRYAQACEAKNIEFETNVPTGSNLRPQRIA